MPIPRANLISGVWKKSLSLGAARICSGVGCMSTADWRMEKAGTVVTEICRLLAAEKVARKAGNPILPDAHRAALAGVVHNATKLFCDAVEELRGGDNRWSPELVDYLFDHPERARETLEIVSSDDYRDGYYDQLSESD